MKFDSEKLKDFSVKVLEKTGLQEKEAKISADCLIEADLRGVHSHGLTHLKDLVDRIDAKTIKTDHQIKVIHTAPSSIVVDADHCIGMYSASIAMEACIEAAAQTGVACATIHNANTYGYGAFYPLQAAKKNMIGISVCNTKAYVAPFGGAEPILGTNPISIAIPASLHPPVLLDFATSEAAVNKIALALKEGRQIPDTWAVDSNGIPTADPALAYEGSLQSFGGRKGYGLQLIISILAYALSQGAMDINIPKAWVETDQECNFGSVMIVIDVSKFVPISLFLSRVDEYLDLILKSKKAQDSKPITYPGEGSLQRRQHSFEEGIELSAEVIEELMNLSLRFDIPF